MTKILRSEDYLGKTVEVVIDRALGSVHPKHNHIIYNVNYGYIENTVSGDGEELDAYVLGVEVPVEKYTGKCIAIIRRSKENDDKLIVTPENSDFTDKQIYEMTEFQEKFFESKIIR